MQNPVFYGAFLAISWIKPRSVVTNYSECMRSNSAYRDTYVTRSQRALTACALTACAGKVDFVKIKQCSSVTKILKFVRQVKKYFGCFCLPAGRFLIFFIVSLFL